MTNPKRPLRADAERSMRAILEAAERLLRTNPAASLEQIAEEAGVGRTTVHRRFANREALLDALQDWAIAQFHAAVDDARPETAPPLIALYRLTANVLRTKLAWSHAMAQASSRGTAASELLATVLARCANLFQRAHAAGLIAKDADLDWALRAYRALIDEAVCGQAAIADNADTDMLATRIVNTLMHGIGTEATRL